MTVHRTIPQRGRTTIGAWCFADHFGPDDVAATGGMDVAPHPHTGLQTLTWLFEGEISHIDSGGGRGLVHPGAINIMTAGAGIAHSETSTPATTVLHGVQLWTVLPSSARNTAPRAFEHYTPAPVTLRAVDTSPAGQARVFVGSLFGQESPVTTYSPLVGAELLLEPGAHVTIWVDASFEHGLLADSAGLELEGTGIPRAAIGYVAAGTKALTVRNTSRTQGRALLLGGEPFEEKIVMWWNFIGRDHDEIVHYRQQWQERSERFGQVEGYVGHGGPGKNADGMSWLPAPKLPHARIKAR